MNQQFDMVIIGGGMVGTALACALKDSPLKIALIETHVAQLPLNSIAQVSDVDARVSALNRASENFLTAIGAWPRIPVDRKQAYDKMRVWDGIGTGAIQFDAEELGERYLGHIIENRFTNSALLQTLHSASSVHVFAPNTVESIEAIPTESRSVNYFVQLDNGFTLSAPLIVAADGAQSKVREWAQFDMREWDYDHHGVVCTVQTEFAHQDCAWQRFTDDGVLAFLPLPQTNLCSIVWSCSPELAQTLMSLSDTEFLEKLSREFEGQLGQVVAVGPRGCFPLRQRHAKQYVKGGIVLVGDAAHTIHPLAGQGVNLGLMDAYVLADEIKQGLARGLAVNDEQLLARYERRRQPENLQMMASMEMFKRVFSARSPMVRWLRNWGMSKVNNLSFVKQHLAQAAMGLERKIK